MLLLPKQPFPYVLSHGVSEYAAFRWARGQKKRSHVCVYTCHLFRPFQSNKNKTTAVASGQRRLFLLGDEARGQICVLTFCWSDACRLHITTSGVLFFYRVSLFKLQPAASGVRPLLPTGSSTIRRLLDAPPTFSCIYDECLYLSASNHIIMVMFGSWLIFIYSLIAIAKQLGFYVGFCV